MFLDEASSINFHAKRSGTFFKEISSELYEQERDNELKDLQDRTHYLCNKLENIQKDSTKKIIVAIYFIQRCPKSRLMRGKTSQVVSDDVRRLVR